VLLLIFLKDQPHEIIKEHHLGETEVDGDGLWDVEEPGVAGQRDGEPVHGLEDVRALVFFKDVHGEASAQRTAPQAGSYQKIVEFFFYCGVTKCNS